METDKGTIETEVVVAACGIYTPDVARLVGVDVPIIPFGHQYLVTEPFDPPLAPLPTLRDPDGLVYWRTEVGGLVQGGYERDPAPWGLDGVPADFEAALLPEDWDRFEELSENAIRRVPAMETAQVKRFFNGPEAFTPDGEFCLGESDRARLLGRRRILRARPRRGRRRRQGDGRVDRRRPARVRRLAHGPQALRPPLPQPAPTRWPAPTRACPSTTTSSTPARSAAARPAAAGLPRLRPARGPRRGFGEKAGWERANWFARNEAAGDEALRPRGWAGQNWSPAIGAEALATRRAAGLFDQSRFSKLEVHGPGRDGVPASASAANVVDRAGRARSSTRSC